ncbi:MAG: peptide chain release factor 1, partial [Betaproteobacteria bacterium]|nr:peptide chain release factor 1 [Betaproteobacteria bacterium]
QLLKDPKALRQYHREHAELSQLMEHFHAWQQANQDLLAAREMTQDPELGAWAKEEEAEAQQRMTNALALLETLMLPKDPNDHRDVLLEIRAGTGGDESALFAGDLLRMYLRYAERRGWKSELLSASESELGGYKEVVVRVAGESVFSRMKFESGGHRVQRIPVTESQGRIHTSACTVAVLAEGDDMGDIVIDPGELRIDVFRASGAGGQHVNKTESAVRITHLPSGIVAECQDDRSQHRNRDKAMQVLIARIRDQRDREAQAKESAHRKSLIGSGDRSERIRTYNFPQGRVTDHRINLTLYRIAAMLDGDIDELLDALAAAHQADLLASLGEP